MKRLLPISLLLLFCSSSPVRAEKDWALRHTLYSNPSAFTTAPKAVIWKMRREKVSRFYDLNERVNYIYAGLSGSQREDIFVRYSYRVTADGSVKDLRVTERHCPRDYERLSLRAIKMVLDSHEFKETLKKSPVYLGDRSYSFCYCASMIPKIPKQNISDEKVQGLLGSSSKDFVFQALAPRLYMEETRPFNRARWLYKVTATIPEVERFPKNIEKVVCTFKLEEDGAVKNLVVSKSSGDANCDARAIALLKKYQPYPTIRDAELMEAGLIVYFDGDMGLTIQSNDGKSDPPHIFYK